VTPALSPFPPFCWSRVGASNLLSPCPWVCPFTAGSGRAGCHYRAAVLRGEAEGLHCKRASGCGRTLQPSDGESSDWYTCASPFPPFCVGRVGASSVLSPCAWVCPFTAGSGRAGVPLQGSCFVRGRPRDSTASALLGVEGHCSPRR